jgi:hypothetical protein
MALIAVPLTAIALVLGASGPARADVVTNGGFESNGGNGQLGYNTSATGWSISGGYSFLFAPGTADTTGASGQYGALSLWGPGNGSANGLPATSPAGGYFLAQDSDFQQAAISQTINGLTAGQQYQLGFYSAGAQQFGFSGLSTDQWQVSLGAQTQTTGVVNVASQGFSGWTYQTMNFTATSSSEVLSFLALGSPSGVPPFALLDGVSLNAVPEPSCWIAGLGMLCLGLIRLRRRTKAAGVAAV